MTDTGFKARLRKLNRYYDPLVDVTFFVMLGLFLYSKGMRFFMTGAEIRALPFTPIADIIFLFTWLSMLFLVAARFMRDEFAQKIWSRAAGSFAYFVIFLSFLTMLTVATFGTEIYLWFEAGGVLFNDRLDSPPPADVVLEKHPSEVVQFVMFYGLVETIGHISLWSPAAFFAIYKFYRWRDSR